MPADVIPFRDCRASTEQPLSGKPRRAGLFRSTILVVEVLPSALRHGVEPEDILHVLRNALVVEDVDEDPTRYLVLGAGRTGQLLELVAWIAHRARQ